MNAPDPIRQQPPQSPSGLSGGGVAAIAIVALLGSLTCAGVCAGIVSLAAPRAQSALQKAQAAARPPANDWWVLRVLSEVYTAALDAAVADQAVIERLGEPIETDVAAVELFRRMRTGALNASSETIEFDIVGPKGTAVVTVDVAGAGAGPLRVQTIQVTFSDGSEIEVTPPPQRDVRVR
jgi:hypothetical protein